MINAFSMHGWAAANQRTRASNQRVRRLLSVRLLLLRVREEIAFLLDQYNTLVVKGTLQKKSEVLRCQDGK